MKDTYIRIHVSDDGYLYGAAIAGEDSANWRYWHPAGDSEYTPCSLQLWAIPDYGDAEVITRHGTSEQYHSDGYEAMNYLRIIGRLAISGIWYEDEGKVAKA